MNNTSSAAVINEEITRHLVADDQRPAMLPRYFPGLHLEAESLIHAWMERLSLGCNVAYWHMYELSNGAFYMAPDSKVFFEFLCPGYDRFVGLSADAAGLVACLCAANQLACQTKSEHYTEFYHRLKDYAFERDEAGSILRAIS